MHNACSSKATGFLEPFPAFTRAPPLNPKNPGLGFLVSSTICSVPRTKDFFFLAAAAIDQCSSIEQQYSTPSILESTRIKVVTKAGR
jgi:hypothetical protein